MKDLDKEDFLYSFYECLKNKISNMIFEAFAKDKIAIDEMTDKYILFSVSNVEMLSKKYGKSFKKAFDDALLIALTEGGSNL